MDSGSSQELAALRRRIDETDLHLASVLRERGSLAARAAKLKARAGVPVNAHRDSGREHEIVERAVAFVCRGIGEELVLNAYDEKAVRAVYNELFEASLRFAENEMRLRVT
jgi:chorismate mutase